MQLLTCHPSSVLSQPLILSKYQKLQVMRFSIEQINNSTYLLPNVSLGYRIFDHCSDARSFPHIFNLLSLDGLIEPWDEAHRRQPQSRVIAVVGPSPSTHSLTLAPLFMVELVPMVRLIVIVNRRLNNFSLTYNNVSSLI